MKKFFLVCFMLLITGSFITGCFFGGDDEGAPSQITSVADSTLISSTIPANGAVDVPLNRKLVITFSEPMDPSTINEATFLVTGPGMTLVPGTVNALVSGYLHCYTATFTPASNFTAGTTYTATLNVGVKYVTGKALAGNIVWSFTTGAASDTAATTASTIAPVNNVTGVAVNLKPLIIFGEAMDPFTVNSNTFTLTGPGSTPVPGTVSYVSDTATFTPTNYLENSTAYTATVTTGVKDLAGNALAGDIAWTFTTGAILDTTPPAVTANGVYGTTGVVSGAVGQPVNKTGTVIFSEIMDPLTINKNTFTLKGPGGTAVAGAVTYVGSTATFTPAVNLAANTLYTAAITKGVKDLAGNALAAEYTWSYTTGAVPDITAPAVTSVTPLNNAANVATSSILTVIFSEDMDPLTLNTEVFTLKQGAAIISGTITRIGNTATFTPASSLAGGSQYTATITTGAKDLADNALAANYIWTFTTATTAAASLLPVNLGTAGNFAILAKSGIDTVPTSAITGNIGVSPAAATYITGFSLTSDSSNVFSTATQVVGKVYASNYAVPTPSNMTNAISDMETAYTDAAGRTTPDFTELHSGDISGRTLVPGLYKWSTNVLINTDVTLNGGANDVWIMQISQGIIQANGSRVILSGGAQAKNIFWQSSGQVTIGTTAHFEGIVFCQTSIALNNGATVNGRLFSQTAVTIKSSTVTQQ